MCLGFICGILRYGASQMDAWFINPNQPLIPTKVGIHLEMRYKPKGGARFSTG
jgi:hypothetical protein